MFFKLSLVNFQRILKFRFKELKSISKLLPGRARSDSFYSVTQITKTKSNVSLT